MGNRGPKPKPAQVLRLRGSWRGKKRGVAENIDHKKPARPIWLKGEAKKCWDNLCPKLYKAGLVTEMNRETLTLLCCAWEDYVEAREQLEKTRGKDGRALLVRTGGKVVGGKVIGGAITENPLLYTMNRAYGQLFKAAAKFGLTPEDINNVRAVDKPATDDIKSKFFNKSS